jgi:ERCC4-related helicase
MMSYYSKQKIAIQRTGRLRQNGQIGRIFVFVTTNTQEEKWYKAMFEGMEMLNFIVCEGLDDCLTKMKNA